VIVAILLVMGLLMTLPQPAQAQPAGSNHAPGGTAAFGGPGALGAIADRVLVVKSERQLYLVRDNTVIRSYRIELGRSPVGQKVFEGDGRTPEGLYVLGERNPSSRFYRSIRISYPSRYDLAEARKYGGRPGGLVMIHGQPVREHNRYNEKRMEDWTEGCIAVSDAEMDEIWAATTEGTPIEILP
jgi:murein L,D-transpeptidase YafK